jgi:hypothetical protein
MLNIKSIPVTVRHSLTGVIPSISCKRSAVCIAFNGHTFDCEINKNHRGGMKVAIRCNTEARDGTMQSESAFKATVELYKAICAYLTYTYSTAHYWSNYRLNKELLDKGLQLISSDNSDNTVLGYQVLKGLGINKKNANHIAKTLVNLKPFDIL